MIKRLQSLVFGTLLSLSLVATGGTSASAFTPSKELQQYQQASTTLHTQKNVAVWDVWQMQAKSCGVPLELRGMVDGTMEVGGQRSFFLRVGVHRLPVQIGQNSFNVSPGTAIYCVATVANTKTFPPDLRLVAYVKNEEMTAWQADQEKVAAARALEMKARALQASRLSGDSRIGMEMQVQWSKEWASGDEARQLQVACQWMQSFNPSLDNVSAMNWARTILSDARDNKIDPRLAMSLMAAESAYQASAVSPVGAQGLGQLMPDTATRLGVSNSFDAVQNIHGSTRYIGQLMNMWGTSQRPLSLVLASYNAGEGAVQQYGGVPPYAETQNYVAYVLSLYRELGGKGI